MLFRKCTKDYQIPGSQIVIRKDTKVMVPLLGLQRDPEFFPNPLTFDPERFSEENKDKIRPFTFMPFGDGLRNCIGEECRKDATQSLLHYILSHFRQEIRDAANQNRPGSLFEKPRVYFGPKCPNFDEIGPRQLLAVAQGNDLAEISTIVVKNK